VNMWWIWPTTFLSQSVLRPRAEGSSIGTICDSGRRTWEAFMLRCRVISLSPLPISGRMRYFLVSVAKPRDIKSRVSSLISESYWYSIAISRLFAIIANTTREKGGGKRKRVVYDLAYSLSRTREISLLLWSWSTRDDVSNLLPT